MGWLSSRHTSAKAALGKKEQKSSLNLGVAAKAHQFPRLTSILGRDLASSKTLHGDTVHEASELSKIVLVTRYDEIAALCSGRDDSCVDCVGSTRAREELASTLCESWTQRFQRADLEQSSMIAAPPFCHDRGRNRDSCPRLSTRPK